MTETNLDWRILDLPTESFTEEDIAAAESAGALPVGKYLAEVIATKAVQKDFNAYSCYACNLKIEVVRPVEIDGEAVAEGEREDLEGRFIFDDIILPHDGEKKGFRNRRLMVAKRLGLIISTSEQIQPSMWFEDIIGKRAIVTLERENWEDKNGNQKSRVKVGFSGYDYANGTAGQQDDDYDDI
jgi:hypothetical protein